MRIIPFVLISFLFAVLLSSCTSNEIGNSKDVTPDAVYFDYKISANEKDSNVLVYLQYRMGGPNGTTLVLNEPSKVLLDGEEIKVDSARLSGAYYEIQKPLKKFAGEHQVMFTDLNKKEYRENFSFKPFELKTPIPKIIKRGNVLFELRGLDSVDFIRVQMTDTSYRSRDIDQIDTVKNGRLIISSARLNDLVNGPITLLLYRETNNNVKNGTREGGRIYVGYGLRREFILK